MSSKDTKYARNYTRHIFHRHNFAAAFLVETTTHALERRAKPCLFGCMMAQKPRGKKRRCRNKHPGSLEFLPETKKRVQKDPQKQKEKKMLLLLLGFPKAKPESGPGCLYCLVSTLNVPSGGAGGPHRTQRRAPGGCVEGGLEGSHPTVVCLPTSVA